MTNASACSQLVRRGEQCEPGRQRAHAEHARVRRRDAAVRQRPHPRPAHQRVGVALVHLVERGRARRRRARCPRRLPPSPAGRRPRSRPGSSRPRCRDDEKIQARLGQREVVGDALGDRRRVGHGDGGRVGRSVFHARAPWVRLRPDSDTATRRCRQMSCAVSRSVRPQPDRATLRPARTQTSRASSAASAPATSSAPARRRRRGGC